MPDNTTTNNTTTNRANVQMCTHSVAKPVQTPIMHISSTVACIEVYMLVEAGYYLLLL